jgi:hypothetical protein
LLAQGPGNSTSVLQGIVQAGLPSVLSWLFYDPIMSLSVTGSAQSGITSVDSNGQVSVTLPPQTSIGVSITVNGPSPEQTVIAEPILSTGEFSGIGTDFVSDNSGVHSQGIIFNNSLSWPPSFLTVSTPLSNFSDSCRDNCIDPTAGWDLPWPL